MVFNLKQIWDNHGFEIILGTCIAFLLLFGLYYKLKGKKGTWSNKYYSPYRDNYTKSIINKNNKKEDSKGEQQCRKVLENIFRKPFNKARPDFLRNPVSGGNFNLELDCYNKELGIAVEFNGIQHYKYVPFFHKNKESFMNQKYRDELKERMCKDNRILLILVPYTIKIENIENYIITELRKNGIKI